MGCITSKPQPSVRNTGMSPSSVVALVRAIVSGYVTWLSTSCGLP